ncbi:MAG TPA: hypothetical protein VHI53_14230 [Gaiellaceae bacterium]|jgi:hypothetical protein|nr:hypothetical protein [Gaiellaceae bacterium]
MTLSPEEHARIMERRRDPETFDRAEREAEAERRLSNRMWAAIMISDKLDVVRSILDGRPVLARQLDPVALRRALRGRPHGEEYIEISADMLDAIAEGGPFVAGELEASTERDRLKRLVDRATQGQPMTLDDADDAN